MGSLKEIGFIICSSMVLMAYLQLLLPGGLNDKLLKGIISIVVISSVINSVSQLKVKGFKFDTSAYIEEKTVMSSIEEGLCKECNHFLMGQKINASVTKLEIEAETYNIKYICVKGMDSELAKELLAARYQIQKSNIEVSDDG